MGNTNINKTCLSVKEFAELVGITPDALRRYDRKGLFQPAKHGTGLENKYRYYVPTQITAAKMIRVLLEIGVPHSAIKELELSRTPQIMLQQLNMQKIQLESDLRFCQEAFDVVSTFADLLVRGIGATQSEVYVERLPEKQIILGEINDFSGSSGYYDEFMRFLSTLHDPKLNSSFPIGGYFKSMAAFLNAPSQPTRFFSLDPEGHETQEGGLYLLGYSHGYEQMGNLPKRMMAYAKKHRLLFTGPAYCIHLFDEVSVTDPDQYLLQVAASVREKQHIYPRRPVPLP